MKISLPLAWMPCLEKILHDAQSASIHHFSLLFIRCLYMYRMRSLQVSSSYHHFLVEVLQEVVVMVTSGGSRTKQPCHCCKRYLDHLDENNQNMSCFLRRMTANSKNSMVVPKRFLKHFDGNLTGTIKLESPNNGRYDVRVTKRFNKVVFCHGWGKFVDTHHIEENDYLLFRHIDKSWFEVLILDSDGCEKVFPCAGISNAPRFKGRSAEYVDTSSNSHHDTLESSASETAKMGAASSASESGEGIPSEKTSLESDDLQTSLRQDFVLSERNYLSEAQEKRVIAVIQEIRPESTAFIAVMRKSHVETPCPYLAISKGYALEHFPHESTHITLQRPGKSKKWHPKFYKGNDKRPYMLRGQWLDFVRDNHVKEGDICLLFPTKSGRRSAFTVYLVPATATHSWGATDFKRVGPCHGRSRPKMPCAVHIEEEPRDGENVSPEGTMCETSHESVESDSGGPSEPPYMVSLKTYLSQSQKRIVEERVRSMDAEVPIFVVAMKKSNVAATHCSMIEFGSQFAAPHLPHRPQAVVLQYMRKTWETKMSVFGSSSKRWFLVGGWPRFARDNGLQVGDICLFELKKNQGKLTMRVHIISKEQF